MEELISSIKEKISNDGYIKSEDLERFTAQFRERGISVMALEEILNFYMTFHPGSNEIHERLLLTKERCHIHQMTYYCENYKKKNTKYKG